MKKYEQILVKAQENKTVQVVFPNVKLNPTEIVQLNCYQAIEKIRDVLQNEDLEDVDCFMRIEEIVNTLEDLGVDVDGRHDF